ncbi:hypothetical protein FA15DRAFT_676557 [Coprinopsis marcescibilis]|uniref:Uncharacterized protein n=1 Tax=Coprinopsis marcescibilis TaxID=230819 RepID=A0A5C3KA73_COPMA|nr:hypothetical protein FA15DRAFT_676557 [Coprinopsis marcescibilis]
MPRANLSTRFPRCVTLRLHTCYICLPFHAPTPTSASSFSANCNTKLNDPTAPNRYLGSQDSTHPILTASSHRQDNRIVQVVPQWSPFPSHFQSLR